MVWRFSWLTADMLLCSTTVDVTATRRRKMGRVGQACKSAVMRHEPHHHFVRDITAISIDSPHLYTLYPSHWSPVVWLVSVQPPLSAPVKQPKLCVN